VAEEGRGKWRSGRKIRASAMDFSGTASVKRIRNAQVACSSHVSSSTTNRFVMPFGKQGGFLLTVPFCRDWYFIGFAYLYCKTIENNSYEKM